VFDSKGTGGQTMLLLGRVLPVCSWRDPGEPLAPWVVRTGRPCPATASAETGYTIYFAKCLLVDALPQAVISECHWPQRRCLAVRIAAAGRLLSLASAA